MFQHTKSSLSLAPAATNANSVPPQGRPFPEAPSVKPPGMFQAGDRAFLIQNQESELRKPSTGTGQASQQRGSGILEFDFTLSPGAEEWQSSHTTDGRAVYSTVDRVSAGVTIEFQKWDW
ncbi:hypothetical protein FRC01_008252 [Tulasnella sp. 417]|nr:hypothetical protein FRC01_008252 [Tulasnella sp. 417]